MGSKDKGENPPLSVQSLYSRREERSSQMPLGDRDGDRPPFSQNLWSDLSSFSHKIFPNPYAIPPPPSSLPRTAPS